MLYFHKEKDCEGEYEFPKESLTGVIFGWQIEKTHKGKIIELCNSRDFKPALYQAEIKELEYVSIGIQI